MSLSRGEILNLSRLSRRRERLRQGRFLVEGLRSVEAAVIGEAPLTMILVTEAARSDPRVESLISEAGCPVEVLPARSLSKVSDATTSQGIVAVSECFLSDSVESLLECPRLVVFASIQDPGNVGTLVRTAAWFGIRGVLADTDTADFENPKVVRASMGGLWDVSLSRVDDLPESLRRIRGAGFEIVGADTQGRTVNAWRPASRTALVLGSEAHGLPREVVDLLDKRLAIGGGGARDSVESLNVAVAGGILMARWSDEN